MKMSTRGGGTFQKEMKKNWEVRAEGGVDGWMECGWVRRVGVEGGGEERWGYIGR